VSRASSRRPLLASVIVAVVGMLLMASPPAWAVLLKAADWQMNETSGQMIDSSGNGNNGSPTDVVQTGSTYEFNGSTSRVVVPNNPSLNPGNKDITLRASVMVPDAPMDTDSYDIVRKGLAASSIGDYKMEIKRTKDPSVGKLHCLFKGDAGRVRKVARPDVVDGAWHTLECIRTSNSVVATVDGSPYTQTGSPGSISNSDDVVVGAKRPDTFDDMFYGSMEFVTIEIAE
jgi:hypothetical protein